MRQGQMLACVSLTALVLGSAVLPAHAAMVLVSRDTELSATGPCGAGDTTCTPAPGGGGILIGHSNDSLTGFGPYSKSVNYFDAALATQQSSISGTHISVGLVTRVEDPLVSRLK